MNERHQNPPVCTGEDKHKHAEKQLGLNSSDPTHTGNYVQYLAVQSGAGREHIYGKRKCWLCTSDLREPQLYTVETFCSTAQQDEITASRKECCPAESRDAK